MKDNGPLKIIAVILGVAVAVLIGFLIVNNKKAAEQHAKDEADIATHSNNWVKVTAELNENKLVITNLETDLTARAAEITTLSNQIAELKVELETTVANTKVEIAKRDEAISKLEGRNAELEKQAVVLTNDINGLNARIADVSAKLVAAEGDKAALTAELKRLLREKAELERKFSDITVLREQIKKIRRDINIQRRLDRAAEGLPASSEPKASERMMSTLRPTPPKPRNYDLNVEVGTDGAVKVIPPIDTKSK